VLHLHIEAAKKIQRVHPIKNIIEYGAGEISTLHFLDLRLFPNLEHLYSFEIQRQYVDCLNITDSRWQLCVIPNELMYKERSIEILTNNKIDVVLVDSLTIGGRIDTLKFLVDFNIDYIVLHDSQYLQYEEPLNKYKYRLDITTTPVYATIVSNTKDLKSLEA
jgi:hypothetical protein